MKVGDYVRTISGISKIENIIDHNDYIFYKTDNELGNCTYSSDGVGYFFHKEDKDEIIDKSSPNIIDLIEVGDYVNGKKVLNVAIDYIFDYSEEIKIVYFDKDKKDYIYSKVDIKSIVTREQFESMEYRIGDWLYESNRFIK